ncbi:ABC transporter ATP-binding protein [Clostridium paraputrificum]|mgnify:FL=1|uniref:ABC transporter ATP-binding protein n=1 Tax=Clostridium TaxID=1485 RepID=UPI000C082A1A|nr:MULTISPECIES: ABC transporter ATP-binding protein [Clostridium]MDB2076500.1 ABC transporter ATP-binding protein [Clostridium paraputrificum]MDB2079159.1 ABC transporter ATP-binding protein [Clostridium paraputrificum]MDB2086303.1 ABC transporter ATP-binding protein [Clostridium paraputrificum]MDB2099545.1 ABC transporter ATP-binding protein [Clostridium paraputrificum]MDU1031794.1 ABC transporter ATP-binding protein [Clostridium sp.]
MNNRGLKFILSYLKEHKTKLIIIGFSIIVYTLTKLIGPFLMGYIIDNYITIPNVDGLLKWVFILFCVYALSSLAGWFQNYVNADVAAQTVNKIRTDLFNKIETLSLRFFDSTPHGELLSRFTNDIDNIGITLSNSIIELTSNLIQLVGVLIFMLVLNIRLAVITLVATPFLAIIVTLLIKRTRRLYGEQQGKLGDLNAYIEEEISGLKVVKAYGLENEVVRRFHEKNKSFKDTAIKAQFTSYLMIPLMNGLSNVTLVLIIVAGSMLTLKGDASIGLIVTFINFARLFFQPINQMSNLYNQLGLAFTGSERVMDILNEEPDIKNTPDAKEIDVLNGYVNMKDVSFSYNDDKTILKRINIEAFKGEKIAIVGPTGSGKTTIINLLNRFYDTKEGEIYFDDLKIKDINFYSLRKRIGIVLQNTILFSGTIKENLLFGKEDATDNEIETACIKANIHDYIISLPKGYDTEITSDSNVFSKGQKQLLSIARTILANPDILILDEATSNVDMITEQKLQQAMNTMMEGRTSFVIAHRLKTIINSDKIVVIKDGKVVEEGTHKDLLSLKGFYNELYQNQFSSLKGIVNE